MGIRTRIHRKFFWRFASVLCVLVAAVIFLVTAKSLFGKSKTSTHIQTVVVMASPVSVWSWDRVRDRFTVVVIPSDVVIDGVHGYGRYSLEALWRLGFIDKKDGAVLSESLSESLAVPVSWYIGPKAEAAPEVSDVLESVKKQISPTGIGSFVFGAFRTNMPIPSYISFSWALQTVRPDRINTIDLTKTTALVAQQLPDGSTEVILDPARLDVIRADSYEDERIRKEGLTVGIYNTTNTGGLGQKAARMLTALGVRVVSVGNEPAVMDGCQIKARSQFLTSLTGRVIAELFSCEPIEVDLDRSDIAVYIGKNYEKKFLPQ